MRFELTVAFKYLIPKKRQLSVSIISLVSILVISLVVWLVILFLSVTEAIEKKWIEELVALNAPVRMTPTEAYFQSYYYQIDTMSFDSNYSTKTIGEKLATINSDPYDPSLDGELPVDFPPPDTCIDGSLRDPIKEGWEAITSLDELGMCAQEHEASFGNLRLNLVREHTAEVGQSYLTQASYITSHNTKNSRLQKLLLPTSEADYNNILQTLDQLNDTQESNEEKQPNEPIHRLKLRQQLSAFFDHISITKLKTSEKGFDLPPALYPEQGVLKGVGVITFGQIQKIIIPSNISQVDELSSQLNRAGYKTILLKVAFSEKKMEILTSESIPIPPSVKLELYKDIFFQSTLIASSLEQPLSLFSLKFFVKGSVQNLSLSGIIPFEHLEIGEVKGNNSAKETPLWVYQTEGGSYQIPCDPVLGDGILISKQFKNKGVYLGDRGHLAYYTPTASSMQEQQIPVYVAGFYDPGMMPIGNKLIFVNPETTALFRGNMSVIDKTLSNGINIWLDDIHKANFVKEELIHVLEVRGIGKYWEVQSFHDYEFARPILQQLKSDKILFTLIAVIILIVACSNIISMLILLVNDKKREIGILQSMGVSSKQIAGIFGICGFATGLISSIVGTLAAIITLHYLKSLVAFLSFLQGHEAFQAAFYGSQLPNELSLNTLVFVILATLIISVLAGLIPAIKASKIHPSEILRAE